MEILALRLVLPPAIVVLASLGQRHLGDRLAGLLIGLPLTSGTYLALILPSHGPAAVSGAACGMLAGQVAVTVTALAYAWLAPRTGTAAALLVTLAVWAATVMALRPVGGVVSAALFVLLATFALLRWPTAPPTTPPMDPTSRPAVGMGELAQRVVLTTGLVFTLTAGTTRLGPQFAGLLAAAPLVVLILTPATHRDRGADAKQQEEQPGARAGSMSGQQPCDEVCRSGADHDDDATHRGSATLDVMSRGTVNADRLSEAVLGEPGNGQTRPEQGEGQSQDTTQPNSAHATPSTDLTAFRMAQSVTADGDQHTHA